jgi:hypothetical protein
MPRLQGLVATLATAFAIYTARAHVLIENDYGTDVIDRTTAKRLQQSNPCKLVGSRVGMGLGFGNSNRKTKGLFKTGMYECEISSYRNALSLLNSK